MSSRFLRLLFVVKSLATQAGGAERVLCQICSELSDRGYSVEIASFDAPSTDDFYPLDARVARHRLGIGDVRSRTRTLELFHKARALRALIRRIGPDVAIGFMHSAFVPLTFGSIRFGVPVIASEHISYDHYLGRPLEKLLVLATAPFCSAITITLERVRDGFPGWIRRKMRVIPNPVVMTQPRPSHVERRQRILFVGNFRPQKDHRTLIEAFGRLAHYSNWDLRLVGGGELEEEVKQQVVASGLGSRVTFTGAISDVASEYALADLFAVPSYYESFGLAAAEALASGIPVVGFADCPGTNELILDGVNGILVSGENRATALAEGLAKLMTDQSLRLQLGARGPASIKRYSIDAAADLWEKLIGEVRGRAGTGSEAPA